MQLSALSMHEHIQEDGEQSPVMHTSSDRSKSQVGWTDCSTTREVERRGTSPWREEWRMERTEGLNGAVKEHPPPPPPPPPPPASIISSSYSPPPERRRGYGDLKWKCSYRETQCSHNLDRKWEHSTWFLGSVHIHRSFLFFFSLCCLMGQAEWYY